ncbi:MAG: RpiB/LacA/LacB family sugar-phosphate isomerase [Dethiobacteria bacterium]|nr:RpiB/LacA/LacB family sugar-phosphate isomerase [Dethiobacteria bacterium]
MRVAVVNEVSAANKNADILKALEGFGCEVINAGMQSPDEQPELTYIHTGLISALLLNLDAVDLVVGGCGTGQGFLNSVMQYPGVFCGLLSDPLDAWLFSQINGGNCISLPLNKGYGWAGDINLKYIFEKLFTGEMGAGYPEHRKESQKESRNMLKQISAANHLKIEDSLALLDETIVKTVFSARQFVAAVQAHSKNGALRDHILKQYT